MKIAFFQRNGETACAVSANSNVTGFYFFSFASSLFTSSLGALNALAFPKCGESLGRRNVILSCLCVPMGWMER